MTPQPPHWAERFFEWYCSPALVEELQGDLYERFCQTLEKHGEKSARRQYVLNVFFLLGPHTLKRRKKSYQQQLYFPMFKNYLTVAWRNLQKRKAYAFINISGLAVGIACAFLILAYVHHELSYDQFHEKKDRLYRASMKGNFGGRDFETTSTPTALMPTLKREFPEVEEGVRVFNSGSFGPTIVKYEDKLFDESRFFFADSTFFEVFSFPLLSGDPKTALNQPNSVVLTVSTALKYFEYGEAVGKVIRANDSKDYVVTGIMDDLPDNSHIKFDFLASFSSLGASKEEIWWSANYLTYFTLRKDNSIASMQEKMPDLMKKYVGDDLPSKNDYVSYSFMPVTDIHLRANTQNELEPGGSISYVYVLSFVAFLIVAIACINYMNLATAKATERGKEVGVRKVMGAFRGQIFNQFMSEAFLITLLAILLAVVLITFALPYFNILTGKNLNLVTLLREPTVIGILFTIAGLVSLLSGSYPALALSGFKPISVLNGKSQNSKASAILRKGLVVFQFGVSIFLIFGTLVVYKQLAYIKTKELGFDKAQILALPVDDKIVKDISVFKSEFLKNDQIEAVSISTNKPTYIRGGYSFTLEGGSEDNQVFTTAATVDKDYVKTLGLQIIEGSDLSEADEIAAKVKNEEGSSVQNSFLLNESAVKQTGLSPEEIVGKKMNFNGRLGQVKAVVKDFHFASLYQPIGPLVLFIENEQTSYILVRVNPQGIESTLSDMEEKWATLAPHRPFSYEFLDQEFESVYQSEEKMGHIFNLFSVMAIFIACLGLFGLSSYTAMHRAKEIGIRKVLGASATSMVLMLSKDYAKLILVSMLLVVPFAYWAMNHWLEDFAFRIEIDWAIPALAVAITLLTSLLTISFESFKAANANPVNSLKSE